MVSGRADGRVHHLDDVDRETVRFISTHGIRDFLCSPGDFRVPEPGTRVVLRRVLRRAVQRDAWVPAQVKRLHRAWHHPEIQPIVDKVHLGGTDPR